jgi:hypothetical protein
VTPERFATEDERVIQLDGAWFVVTGFAPHASFAAYLIDPESGARTRVYYTLAQRVIRAAS